MPLSALGSMILFLPGDFNSHLIPALKLATMPTAPRYWMHRQVLGLRQMCGGEPTIVEYHLT